MVKGNKQYSADFEKICVDDHPFNSKPRLSQARVLRELTLKITYYGSFSC